MKKLALFLLPLAFAACVDRERDTAPANGAGTPTQQPGRGEGEREQWSPDTSMDLRPDQAQPTTGGPHTFQGTRAPLILGEDANFDDAEAATNAVPGGATSGTAVPDPRDMPVEIVDAGPGGGAIP